MNALGAWLIPALAGIALTQTAAPGAAPPRAEIKAVEQLCDKAIGTYAITTIDQISHARAIYIEDYGVLITVEVNLVQMSPLVGMFGGLSQAQKDKIREDKLKRLPEFRDFLESMMPQAAKALDHMAPQERLMVYVELENNMYEDGTGLPRSISLVANKQDLLDALARKSKPAQLSAIMKEKVE